MQENVGAKNSDCVAIQSRGSRCENSGLTDRDLKWDRVRYWTVGTNLKMVAANEPCRGPISNTNTIRHPQCLGLAIHRRADHAHIRRKNIPEESLAKLNPAPSAIIAHDEGAVRSCPIASVEMAKGWQVRLTGLSPRQVIHLNGREREPVFPQRLLACTLCPHWA